MTHPRTASPEAIKKAIALSNSIPLDVHRWGDHPKIDKPHNISERRAYRALKML